MFKYYLHIHNDMQMLNKAKHFT